MLKAESLGHVACLLWVPYGSEYHGFTGTGRPSVTKKLNLHLSISIRRGGADNVSTVSFLQFFGVCEQQSFTKAKICLIVFFSEMAKSIG